MLRLILILVFAATAFARPQPQPPAQPAPQSDLGKKLDEAVLRAKLGQFWGAVLVAKDGQPILAKGYGYADESLGSIGPDTLFDIGSVTKQFTAAAILKLQSQGKLKTSDAIAKCFPKLADKLGERGKIITVHHLLTHTSGMADERAIQQLDFADRDEAVRIAVTSAPSAAPGEKFDYCNAGYIVLAAAIEHITGGTYENYVRENLFKPAGMTSSGFLDGVGLDHSKATARIVSGQRGMPERRMSLFASDTGEPWAWGLRGAGGVLTTMNDLIRWDRALAGDAVLDATAKEELFTPALEGYACGWYVVPTGAGTIKQHHSGGTRGFRAQLARFPKEGVVIAVLTNDAGNPFEIEKVIIHEVFPDEREEVATSIYMKGFKIGEWGAWESAAAFRWSVKKDGVGVALVLQHPSGDDLAKIWLPRGPARKLAGELAAQTPVKLDPPTGPPIMRVKIGTKPYTIAEGRIDLPPNVVFQVMDAYYGVGAGGERIVEKGPTLIIVDNANQFWPLIITMDPIIAAGLITDLEAAADSK